MNDVPNILNVERLSMRFSGLAAIDDLSLDVAAGSVVVSPSRARNACSRRTATSVRAADDAASGGWSASPVRRWARKSETTSSPTPSGVVMPREERYAV